MPRNRSCSIPGAAARSSAWWSPRRLAGGASAASSSLAVEEWAAERGLGQLSVRSNIVRAESHPFYERLGFVKLKTQHAYRKQLP